MKDLVKIATIMNATFDRTDPLLKKRAAKNQLHTSQEPVILARPVHLQSISLVKWSSDNKFTFSYVVLVN